MSDRGILIIGCGFTGAVLAQRLAFKGEAVYGTTRTETQADVIRTRGAQAVMLDVSDLKPLKRLKGRVRAVVSLVPPKMDDSGGYTDAHGALAFARAIVAAEHLAREEDGRLPHAVSRQRLHRRLHIEA